ncbi:hypothetical protein BU16DRAFT_582997 [Lophium mytilinum]|uniref:BTB domain-containing protein n=1 Tax=Lophium mytilinum TaxID=390894 RepID=A0A6A6QPR3_9PEZI|nr:hypothetical protein BU16DRAFT_582997 [Lophium mytilinum]
MATSSVPPSPATVFVMPPLVPCPHSTALPPITAYDELVSVIVGQQKKVFRIHKGVLSYHSSYFAAALEGQFKEGNTGVVELEDDEVEVFHAFYCWIYTRRLRDPLSSPLHKDALPQNSAETTLSDLLLCKIYIFGDMRGIPGLQNNALDALHKNILLSWRTLSASIVNYVYSNTVEKSQLRCFIVQLNISGYHDLCEFVEKRLKKDRNNYPMDFVIDILQIISTKDKSGAWPRVKHLQETWAKLDRCEFHDHSGPGGALRKAPGNGPTSA